MVRPPEAEARRRPRSERSAGRRDRDPRQRWFWIVLGALALVLAVRLGPGLFSGGDGIDAGSDGPTSTPSGQAGGGGPFATVSADFPGAAVGPVDLKVVALGDHPDRCTAAGLVIGGDVRTVYHHDCDANGSPERPTAYFFFVSITNHRAAPETVTLGELELRTADGRSLHPFSADAVGFTASRYFPSALTIASDATAKGWVAFDGQPAATPESLAWVTDRGSLIVRFDGTWRRP